MQHVLLEIVCLGINQTRPEQGARCRLILKTQISQAISTTEGNLYGTESARYRLASGKILPLAMPSRRPSGLVKHRYRPANFSRRGDRLTAQPPPGSNAAMPAAMF